MAGGGHNHEEAANVQGDDGGLNELPAAAKPSLRPTWAAPDGTSSAPHNDGGSASTPLRQWSAAARDSCGALPVPQRRLTHAGHPTKRYSARTV